MAVKKIARAGNYILLQEDSGTIAVFRDYDNVKGALREAAESNGLAYDNNWTTRQFGTKLCKELGNGKMAKVGEYFIMIQDSGSIGVLKHYANTLGALREIAKAIRFTIDPKWNTRTAGSKLIDAINK